MLFLYDLLLKGKENEFLVSKLHCKQWTVALCWIFYFLQLAKEGDLSKLVHLNPKLRPMTLITFYITLSLMVIYLFSPVMFPFKRLGDLY